MTSAILIIQLNSEFFIKPAGKSDFIITIPYTIKIVFASIITL